ncbi:HAD family hydrolase [Lentilactobacillus parabuchneri]|jgi:HAD superfamily hydrolase (TIGR01549 family)|uniref:HAD-superfamily hydrolase n=1 Tax=Lentilactobacillus parabuchneri DSM 5707 = NBRC 107865 TaxID=1423784 RepID=A0A0R1YW69_9LACO|nr:HAD family hydrolase [Lentilactobacillus parabuchneri]KRM46625.1 HAD-superfamily hydrolase [Lentilactobacillus parabuchneri DSM 5707 = NBRC 107865]KRN76470.1 HAD-superfamily hydrolase [Lentilactobacillus parabuchneri]MBW0222366.1 HAD family hydrolase [Lentilactobacillus parabuchneri]MBW0244551.1 HAD family hydrolase [Lentilactobacillus parabuchneri]MCT2885645.1 HAD family hydrolase [Lentilactobacillus parabuchneri]
MNYLIFDVDGTLIDTEKMYMLPLQKTLNENGYDFSYADVVKVFGITSLDAVKILGVSDPEAIQKQWFAKIKDYTQYTTVYDGIEPVLKTLHDRSDVKMAIATSKQKDEFERDVTRFGLDQYFDKFVFSNEIKHGKPAPDMILKGIEKLAADPASTIYVGDTVYDLKAAHAANVGFALAGWRTKKTADFQTSDYDLKTPNELLSIV